MKLFDRISEEESDEVEISASQQREVEETVEESRLKDEVETEIAGSSGSSSDSSTGTTGLPGTESSSSSTSSSATGSSSSSSSGSDSMLPGMGSSSSSSTTSRSKSVDMEDIHEQNKEIIGLLKDIKAEVGGTDQLL